MVELIFIFSLGGLYCWIFITHQVFLFKYEIQSKVFLFTKKIPIDESTTYSYGKYQDKSSTIHYINFVTPTQNKKLTIQSRCWNNEGEFLTELGRQTSRLRSSTPHLDKRLAKKAKRHKKKKKSKKNRRHKKKRK